jgi:hypothetical protein
VTRHPTQQWVAQQWRAATPNGVHPKFMARDNDSKFGAAFDRVAKSSGIEVLKIPYRALRADAVCERFLASLRRECLDPILIFSQRQLYRVVRGYVSYFNRCRPHQGLQQPIPEQIENESMERVGLNKIILLPGLKEKDAEGRGETAAKQEAIAGVSRGKIIAFPVLNGLHHDYRCVA